MNPLFPAKKSYPLSPQLGEVCTNPSPFMKAEEGSHNAFVTWSLSVEITIS